MKYLLLLVSLVVAASAWAGGKEEDQKRREVSTLNLLVGVGGIALVNEELGNQSIQKNLKREEDSSNVTGMQQMKKNGNDFGAKWAQGAAGFGSLNNKN